MKTIRALLDYQTTFVMPKMLWVGEISSSKFLKSGSGFRNYFPNLIIY